MKLKNELEFLMQELTNRVQQIEARAGQAEQQAQTVLEQMQQKQKSQVEDVGSFASKYQPSTVEDITIEEKSPDTIHAVHNIH